MFTAPLMLELAEEELLTLDDTLQQWEIDLPSASLITIRQLLNHTSGLADYQNNAAFTQLLAAQPDRVWTPQDLVAYAVELDPVGKPGQSHAYSNANYILAAMIAEAATGTTYSEALHTHVLDPTGLRHVYVEGDEDWAEPTATGYLAVSGGVPQDATGVYHPSQTWSAGAVVATVDDLRQWVAILLSTDALSPESQDELLDLVPTPGAIHGYGLGLFAIESGAGIVYGHNGAVMGFQAAAFYHPGTGASVAVMQNLISVDGAGNLVADPTLLALEIFAAIPR
jgi:D-alanyl-D-alanine carboxypeptidase